MQSQINENTDMGLYGGVSRFVESRSRLTYREFDDCVLKELRLFDVPSEGYLDSTEKTLDSIIRALPHFDQVFVRPIIRLKDEHRIVPIEAVKVIDKRSLTHVATRCELWEDITETGIKPRKLMTVENVETYSIYENTVFACAVDTVLSYIKQTALRMKDVFYGCKDIHFNLLDKTHHSLYFLAIGKLYLEYVRSGVSLERWARCMDKMLHIDKALRRRLASPVYQKCRKKHYNIKLKKTNIFRSHKDYKEIYRVMSLFKAGVDGNEELTWKTSGSDDGFKAFCKLITVFATGHFSYSFGEHDVLDLKDLSFNCTFSDWRLSVKELRLGDIDAVRFTTVKDTKYTTAVIFGSEESFKAAELDAFKSYCGADEYLFCSTDAYGGNNLYLSILDVDSFRRIQQILLRGMIYSDKKRTICPFCGGETKLKDDGYECPVCHADVSEHICADTQKKYYVSTIIRGSASYEQDKRRADRRKFLHDRYNEAQLHYRNITPINDQGEHICPHCGKQHINVSEI